MTETCPWCGQLHAGMCPRVKAIEYDGDQIKRVEFFFEGRIGALPQGVETDADLRAAGKQTVNQKRIETDIGAKLDEVAGFYGLIRGGKDGSH